MPPSDELVKDELDPRCVAAFIGNLGIGTTKHEIMNALGGASIVRNVEILRNRTGKSKRCAHATFYYEEGFTKALADGAQFDGRVLRLEPARDQSPRR